MTQGGLGAYPDLTTRVKKALKYLPCKGVRIKNRMIFWCSVIVIYIRKSAIVDAVVF